MPRAVLYIRVSSEKQSLENQLPALQQMAATRGLDIVEIYQEKASGAKKARPEFQRMLRDAKQGKFDYVLVWALDRLTRSQMTMMETVLDLDRVGVKTLSYQETWLEMEGPLRGLLIGIFGWLAEQERARIMERTHAAVSRARKNGTKMGRKKRELSLDDALRHRKAGLSLAETAIKLGVGKATLFRALQSLDVPAGMRTGTV